MKVYTENYDRLEALGLLNLPVDEDGTGHVKIMNPPYMPLTVEWIAMEPPGADYKRLSICHYGEMNGDLMRDPEMVLRVRKENRTVEAEYWRNDWVGQERYVYPEREGVERINPAEKQDQNAFLTTWLRNLKDQGFKYEVQA